MWLETVSAEPEVKSAPTAPALEGCSPKRREDPASAQTSEMYRVCVTCRVSYIGYNVGFVPQTGSML